MIFQERRDRASRLVVLFHAQRQGLCAAQDQPRIEWRKNRARAVLHELNPARIVFVVQQHGTANSVRMAVEELGGRVDDDVHAEFQRPLQVRRHKRVVANYASAGGVGHLGNCFQVRNDHHGIRRRLDKDHARIVFDGGLDVADVGGVNKAELDAIIRKDAIEQTEGAAVRVVRNDDVLAAFD